MMSVAVSYARGLEVSPPRRLFEALSLTSGPFAPYSVSRDGSEFLMIDPFEDPRAETFTIIAHWSNTLKP
jgi:hypothetical protein